MQFHRRHIWSRVFLPTLVALPITSLALMTQPVQQAASPCWYPTVASSTAPYNGAPADIHPTAIPGLSRRQSGWRKPDTLGWNDSLTCNVGVCNPTGYCTVFASHSPRDSVVTGICCPTGATCAYQTTCVAYTSHTMSTISRDLVIDGTAFCGSVYSICASVNMAYGYGLGTILWRGCDTYSWRHFTANSLWMLYRDETSPAKGPMPTTTFSSTPTISVVVITLTASREGHTGIPVGVITGVVIGGIIVVVLGVVTIMVVRSKLQKPNLTTEFMAPFEPNESVSPAPVYTSSTGYPSPHQQELDGHQQPVWEADSGRGIDAHLG